MRNNLIICVTPLQMLIAEKIIDLYPDDNYHLLVMYYDDNEKYNYYYEKLSSKCLVSFRLIMEKESKIYRLYYFFQLVNLLKNKFDSLYYNIYFASVDSFFIHYICSSINYKDIITFDDGVANIYKKGLYYKNRDYSLILRYLRIFLGIRYNLKEIVSISEKHYTIFNGVENICKNSVFLPLFISDKERDKESKEFSIFLGQPYSEYNIGKNININAILSKIGVINYFPHPRERNLPEAINIINSNLIIEDYVITLLNQGYNVKVYSFLSTALLNLNSIDNVSAFLIYDKQLYEKYTDLYEFFFNSNIETLDLEGEAYCNG